MRWNRGVLPVGATLAVFLLIFSAAAAPSWFAHNGGGYAQPSINANLLGILTLILVPLQLALIVFAMRGFKQGWNVEVEVSTAPRAPRRPATAPERRSIVGGAPAGVAER